ncbi:MAG: ACP S-malonyltransferase [Chloroflexi bacterium]|nr:ACP S-malonyltransferase [Chloroflexota bacterium]
MANDEACVVNGASAWVFPGQGSQHVGMGQDLCGLRPEAKAIFDEADQALGFCLSSLCFEGPAELLQETTNAQPAILTTSYAWLRVLQDIGLLADTPLFLAGHSLGEFTALVAAGSLSFSDAVKLVRVRGRMMAEAGNGAASGMAAVMGFDALRLDAICRELRYRYPESGIQVANFNSPEQTVISGGMAALEEAMAHAKQQGAKRIVPLPVSAAFHSGIMEEMARAFAKELDKYKIRRASIPVIANVTAKPVQEPDEIRDELVRQFYSPVQWMDSVRYMAASGVESFVEVGSGKVLTGLAKRIVTNAGAVDSESLLSRLTQQVPAS